MNHLQQTAIGLDASVKTLQIDIYDGLVKKYPSISIEGFGRAYKNHLPEQSFGVVPELFVESTKDYQEAYFKDKYPFSFFFIDGNNHPTQDQVVFTTDLNIIFQIDLSKFNSGSRVDAQIQKEVIQLIKNETDGDFEIEGIRKTVDEIFRGFVTKDIKLVDLHPYHVFSVYGTLGYNLNNKC